MVELAVAVAPADPSFFLSAPSSPRPFDDPAGRYYYTSAPASPSRAAAIYTGLFGPDEKPASPRPGSSVDDKVPEFSFCFHGNSMGDCPTLSITAADELFEEGIIRTVMPMPSWVTNEGGGAPHSVGDGLRRERGRRTLSTSLSPLRGGCEGVLLPRPPSSSPATSALSKGGSGSKKWKFSDLFLFRSASEGRATGRGSKDPLRKYTLSPPASSTKRANGGGSTRRGSASLPSAHEIYYSANRAASEEQKKKQMTPLAYERHGLFGYLRDNPAIHSITKGFGGSSSLFSRRQR
ncbi:hypothetical protein OPV22_026733 [Ensete ventricosum]|uniref:DUF4005 domain-containing protein n=1 Tax=Ensete ventricosum TaxID=4639 RepID=A0AAV8Q3R9_ENSVE|nr:hypothetical protein OPV22_026733 [Ensete ventricosum]